MTACGGLDLLFTPDRFVLPLLEQGEKGARSLSKGSRALDRFSKSTPRKLISSELGLREHGQVGRPLLGSFDQAVGGELTTMAKRFKSGPRSTSGQSRPATAAMRSVEMAGRGVLGSATLSKANASGRNRVLKSAKPRLVAIAWRVKGKIIAREDFNEASAPSGPVSSRKSYSPSGHGAAIRSGPRRCCRVTQRAHPAIT